MRIGYSDLLLMGSSPEITLEILSKHKAEAVEIFLENLFWGEDNDISQKILKSPVYQDRLPLSLHPPTVSIDLSCDSQYLRLYAVNEIVKVIKLASQLAAEYVVIHPGFCCYPPSEREKAKDRARESMDTLVKEASSLGVKLAVENIGYNGEATFYTLDEYIQFLNEFDEKNVVALLDIGHAFLNKWPLKVAIAAIGQRLYSLHLHDNDGIRDKHLPIGQGIIPWEEIWDGLREAPRVKQLILEYSPDATCKDLAKARKLIKSELSITFSELI